MLDLGGAGVKQEELDVRETPTAAELESEYQESTGAQNLTAAGGWTDITGLTKTFTLEKGRSVVIFANVQAIMPAGEDIIGCSARINIDGVAKTDSVRGVKFDLYEDGAFNDVVPADDTDTQIIVSTQFLDSLAAGSHTIKIQADCEQDGVVGWGAQLPSAKSNMSILII